MRAIFAARDISRGEELTNSYLDPLLPRKKRLKILETKFKFLCSCAACSLVSTGSGEGTVRESDKRRKRIKQLDNLIARRVQQHKFKASVVRDLRDTALLTCDW